MAEFTAAMARTQAQILAQLGQPPPGHRPGFPAPGVPPLLAPGGVPGAAPAPAVGPLGIPEPLGSFLAGLPKPELFLQLPSPDVDAIVTSLLAWVPSGAPAFLHPNPHNPTAGGRRGVKRPGEDGPDDFAGPVAPPVDIYAARKLFRA
eukprot:tig00020710_g13319.t1